MEFRPLVTTMGTVVMEFWVLENVPATKASVDVPVISVLLVIMEPTAQVAKK